MSREYTYNNQIGKLFLEGVSKGLPFSTACKYARVPRKTMEHWLKQGEKGTDPVLTKLYEDYLHTFAVRTLEVIEGFTEEAYIYKALQAFNDDFNTTKKVDVKQDTAKVDMFNKDKMVKNLEEIVRERKKRNSE